MEDNDKYSALGTMIFAIAASITWFWKIEPLNYLFTFILGSFVTYYIQGRLQDRAEKRKKEREIIEKIYGPINTEIQHIYDNLVIDFKMIFFPEVDFGDKGECELWSKIKTYPEFFSIPTSIRNEIDEIVNYAEKINNSIDEITRIITPKLLEISNHIMAPHFHNVQNIFLEYRSKRDTILYPSNILNYVVLNIDPIKDMKNRFENFSFDHFYVVIIQSARNISIPFTEEKDKIYHIINETKNEIIQDEDVLIFMENRDMLSNKIKKLKPKIEKYIERNYPIMKL